MDFREKRIVLIGGSAGIGLATAKRASQLGASVVIASRSRRRLQSAEAQIEGPVQCHRLEATDERAVAQFFTEIGAFDHLSVLVPGATDNQHTATFDQFLKMDSSAFQQVSTNRFWTQCYAARHVSQRFYPFLNYSMPEDVLDGADERMLRLLGKHSKGAYG